jgi:hypothetical protein
MLRAFELHDFRAALTPSILVEMLHGGQSSVSLRAHVHHNLEALDSRRRHLGSGLVDYALVAKPMRKISQLFSPS